MKLTSLSLACLAVCLVWSVPLTMAQADPLTGTWVGDWGPSASHRNPVTVELNWDGTALTGTVNPGPNAIELAETAYDASTGTVRMEAVAESFRGMVHYVIEGKVDGNTIEGTWTHDNREGSFTITRNGG